MIPMEREKSRESDMSNEELIEVKKTHAIRTRELSVVRGVSDQEI